MRRVRAQMRDKYGVIDLGLDESQDYLISPEFSNVQEAIRRLKSTFNEHQRLPQVYAVRNLSSGHVIRGIRRNAAARREEAERRARTGQMGVLGQPPPD